MNNDPEITAISSVYTALKVLNKEDQQRVMDYVAKKLGLTQTQPAVASTHFSSPSGQAAGNDIGADSSDTHSDDANSEDEGISPIALKWMRRNGLAVAQLGGVFSLGADEIDLVAKSVPGGSKNTRTRSVVLLKGIAAYLSTGVARMTSEQVKEACLHYDAYDPPNHAKYLKGLASELSGNKSNGFILTARGMTAATEMIKEMVGVKGGA